MVAVDRVLVPLRIFQTTLARPWPMLLIDASNCPTSSLRLFSMRIVRSPVASLRAVWVACASGRNSMLRIALNNSVARIRVASNAAAAEILRKAVASCVNSLTTVSPTTTQLLSCT
ncbi:hypothetical protein D3C81_1688110 [compost metagenome]